MCELLNACCKPVETEKKKWYTSDKYIPLPGNEKYHTLIDFSKKINNKNELLAGFTVAMTMIPESLSFAILAESSPLTVLYTAFMMG